eukprot:5219047-Lingulodinium_polyedra.AAC.1
MMMISTNEAPIRRGRQTKARRNRSSKESPNNRKTTNAGNKEWKGAKTAEPGKRHQQHGH